MGFGEPRYEKIEFCHNAETLWGKIESGRYDWLGVHPKGQFVVGSPPASGLRLGGAVEVLRGGAEKGKHGVRTDVPGASQPSYRWFLTEDEARGAFEALVAELKAADTKPRLIRVTRIEGTFERERETIVQKPSTYR